MRYGISSASALALAFSLAAPGAFAADLSPVDFSVADEAPPHGLIWSGDLTLFVGYGDVDDPDDELDDTSSFYYGGLARGSAPLGNNFSMQLDLLGEANTVDTEDEGSIQVFGVGGHLSWRDPNLGLLGVFAGAGRAVADTDDSANVWWAGVEGQVYWNMLTLYGQVGWAEADNDHDPLDWASPFARGVVRYFVNQNFLLEGEVSYTQAAIHSDDMDAIGWGAKAKFGLWDTPAFMSLEYRGTHYDGHSEGSATEHVGLVGLTLLFGGSGTLLEQDRRGATLDTSSLPLRAAAWTSPLD